MTWRQVLEIFRPSATVALCTAVPIALLNTGGYYDLLLDFLLHSTAQQFVSQAQTDLLIVERDPAVLLERIAEALPAARTGQAPDLSRS